MSKNKYYAVKLGRNTGIFTTWEDCQRQVVGFPNSRFKSFTTLEDAKAYMDDSPNNSKANVKTDAIAYVDGSYNSDTLQFGCGVVFITTTGEEYISEGFNDAELADMRNVAGEIMGAIRAMQLCLEKNLESLTIYYDYNGIEKWCTGEWKASRPGTIMYKNFCDMVLQKLSINFVKVKSHSGDKYNDMADSLAKKSIF